MTERELCWGYGISIEDVDRALGRRPRSAQPTATEEAARDVSGSAPGSSAAQIRAADRRAVVR